jgi:hypothetical protein
MLSWLKQRKIDKLKQENQYLRKELDTWKRTRELDKIINRVVNFYSTENYFKYLELRAEYNLSLCGLAEEIGPDSTPKILEHEKVMLWRRMGALKRKYEADLEANYLLLKKIT